MLPEQLQYVDVGWRAIDGESVDADLVRLYFGDIGRHRLLSRADERRLGAMMATGRAAASELVGGQPTEENRQDLAAAVAAGAYARQQFIESNLRLVVALAKRYQGHAAA